MHAYHVVAVSPSDAGDVGEAWGALERLLDGAAAERVVLAECVVQSGHSRIESRALREHGKGVAALEEGHLDDVGLDRAVGMGGVEAAEPDHIRIELGEGDDRIEVVVERAGGFAPAAADAVFKVLFAFDGVLQTHGHLEPKVVESAGDVAEYLELKALAGFEHEGGGDVGDRPRRKVGVALGRVVQPRSGVAFAPQAAHLVGEGGGLLLRWECLVAIVPGLAGSDGFRAVGSTGDEAHEGAVRDHLIGVGLGDVYVEFGVSVRVADFPDS